MKVRLFVEPAKLKPGKLRLQGEEHHYLSKVRRLKAGDSVTLLDGEGHRALAQLQEIQSKQSILLVANPETVDRPSFSLHMAPALIKGERMEQAITKLVELGVQEISPIISQRTIVRIKPSRAETKHHRFVALTKAASRQSENPYPSQIHPIVGLSSFLSETRPDTIKLIPSFSPSALTLRAALAPYSTPASAVVLIGPEGGFTEEEVTNATKAGFQPVSLGKLTLRAETASIAVASIMNFCFGELGKN